MINFSFNTEAQAHSENNEPKWLKKAQKELTEAQLFLDQKWTPQNVKGSLKMIGAPGLIIFECKNEPVPSETIGT